MRYREGDVSCSTDEQWVCLPMSVAHNHHHGANDNTWHVSLLFSWTEYLGVFRDGSHVHGGRNSAHIHPLRWLMKLNKRHWTEGGNAQEKTYCSQRSTSVFHKHKVVSFDKTLFLRHLLYLTKSNQQTQNKTSATAKHRRSHSSQTSKFQIKGPLCLNHVRKRSLHKLGYCSAGSGSAEFEPSSGISTWTCSWVSNVQVATGTVPWLSDGSCLTFLQR